MKNNLDLGWGENASALESLCEQFQSPLKWGRGIRREGKGVERLPRLEPPVLAAFQS